MLITFAVFAVVFVSFLLGALFYLAPRSHNPTSVPGMDPTDENTGNLDDISQAGSFHEFLQTLHETHGPIASFWYKTKYCISVSSPSGFKDVQRLFDRPALIFEFLYPLIGRKSIQFANGVEGMQRHKVAVDILGYKNAPDYFPKLLKISEELCSAWKSFDVEEHIPVHEYMIAVAIRMISSVQFGAHFQDLENTKQLMKTYNGVAKCWEDLLSGALTPNDTEKYSEYETCLKKLKDFVREVIQAQKDARNEGDYEKAPLLDALIDDTDDDMEQLVGDVTTFFIGGFHTTGNLLAWCLYFLAIYPECQEKLRQELNQFKIEKFEDVNDLKYLSQVIDESLRLSQVAPLAARVNDKEDMMVLGHRIPKGTPIINALGVSFFNESLFPNPGDFDPDRFAKDKKRSNVDFVPFGVGQRRCPGYLFSRMEATAIISVLVKNLIMTPAFDNDVFIQPSYGFVTKPETEIWLKVRPVIEE